MQRTTLTWRRRVVFPVALLLCVLSTPAFATQNCYGPYTLNSDNYAPDTVGDDVQDWVGDFTINLAVTSGTLNVSVESKLNGGAFTSLGQMTTTGIAQFHGPLHKLRYLVTSCSSCLATVIACANRGQ
jgi:hypothetical protein